MSRLLWVFQTLLAALFAFSCVFKLTAPADLLLTMYSPLPDGFIRLIGTAEGLGALGLILPSLLRIAPRLTPLAASGLLIIMASATVLTPTVMAQPVATASIPLVIGVLAGFVAYGRTRLAPIHSSVRQAPQLAQA